MTKLTLLGAAAILATALATPAMAQEATQEPGMIGFNYPNSNYLRGGYGVRTPSRMIIATTMGYGPRVYYGPGPLGLRPAVAVGTAAAIAGAPYRNSYGYYEGPVIGRAGRATATKRP
jgi:hypothetical protein